MSEKLPRTNQAGYHVRCDLCGRCDHFPLPVLFDVLAAIAIAGWYVPVDIDTHRYFCPDCKKDAVFNSL